QQTLTLTTTAFAQFEVKMTPPVPWLVPSLQNGSITAATPVNIALNISPSALPTGPGTYTTSVTINVANAPSPAPITVTLFVSSNPILKLDNSAVTLSSTFANQNIVSQQVNLTSTGGAVPFTITKDAQSPWLSVSPTIGSASSSTPATLTISANLT